MNQGLINVLVMADHNHDSLSVETKKAVNAAYSIAQHRDIKVKITVLVAGYKCREIAEQAAKLAHINKVILADNRVYQYQLAENIAQLIQQISPEYSHIIAGATTFGKDVIPRVAALLNVGQFSDVIAFTSASSVLRPIYAGNAIAEVKTSDPTILATIQNAAFDGVTECNQRVDIETINHVFTANKTRYISRDTVINQRPSLASARVVVAGGRGLGSKDNFAMVETLADKLNAAVGASRAAVDAGYISNDMQVGQTGKIVAPELYIAIGISGAIQHIAGMKDAKVIVAINSDPDAPILEIADYSLVGDLFKLLPELIAKM